MKDLSHLNDLEPVVGTMLGRMEVAWREFLRGGKEEKPGWRRTGVGVGFRIEFPGAALGPVAPGASSHFGMEIFMNNTIEILKMKQ